MRSGSTAGRRSRLLEAMTGEELAELRERLVLEATARVLEAIGSETGPRGFDEGPVESSGS